MAFLKVSNSLRVFNAPDKAGEPVIPEGAKLTCSGIAPKSGDYVVFLPNDGSAPFLRLYIVQDDGSILLHAPNKSFDSYVSGSAELEAAGRLLPVIRMERAFPALERSGAMAIPPSSSVQTLPGDSSASTASSSSGLLTFEEAQAALKVRRTKMYELLRNGELKASKVGKLWRVETSSIESYLKGNTFKSKAPKPQ